jgi:hypothetical protein
MPATPAGGWIMRLWEVAALAGERTPVANAAAVPVSSIAAVPAIAFFLWILFMIDSPSWGLVVVPFGNRPARSPGEPSVTVEHYKRARSPPNSAT